MTDPEEMVSFTNAHKLQLLKKQVVILFPSLI